MLSNPIANPLRGAACGINGSVQMPPNKANLLAAYRTIITDGKLVAHYPGSNHTTQQVKGSAFTGAGSATVTGLLTTDTITAGGGTVPTCTVNGTLTISADCWDVYVHRDGVVWASWKGINVSGTFELDASGNGHTLYLTDTTITERLDGSGTNWCNENGFSVADGSQCYDETLYHAISDGVRIPAIVGGGGVAAYTPQISSELVYINTDLLLTSTEQITITRYI